MLKALGDFFEQAFGENADPATDERGHGLQLATALLLVEVARADYAVDPVEDEAIFHLLARHLDLRDAEVKMLITEARAEADHAASLQQFTRLLHEELTLDEKHSIIEMLWRVALADDHLDKHEDHLIRKIAGLLYVSHSDLIRIRNKLRQT
jgi:uncharacterized tellurite resistance protein B-like protein